MNIILILVIILIVEFFLLRWYISRYNELKHKKQSQSVLYGKKIEQFFPFMDEYPYNPNNFRFIGNPIDGIQFENDAIYIVDFKTNKSTLSEKQKNIRDIIESKKVYFKEFKF